MGQLVVPLDEKHLVCSLTILQIIAFLVSASDKPDKYTHSLRINLKIVQQ